MNNKMRFLQSTMFAMIICCCLLLLCTGSPAYAEDVIAFGDSITRGSNDPSGSDAGGYPLVLQQIYDGQSLSVFVHNRGVAGERTTQGVNRIASEVSLGRGYILIQEGNNDVIWGVSPQTVIRNLGIMIDKSEAASVVPLLATLTPDDKNSHTEYINSTVNPQIRNLAAEKGVSLADTFGAVATSWDVWSFDGLHPNYDGMAAIARTWHALVPIPGSGGGTQTGDDGGGGGCFIATAAFGSLLEPQVVLLRQFRDNVLLATDPGRLFVSLYYRFSPPVADVIAGNVFLKSVVRICLYPLVGLSYLLTHTFSLLFFWSFFGICAFFILILCRRESGKSCYRTY